MNKIINTVALIFVITVIAACQPQPIYEEPGNEDVSSCDTWEPEFAHPDDSRQELYDKLSRNTAMQRLCDE